MPNIREYVAPNTKLNPDEKGYAAWETAGRRIGPLYNQAAQDVEKQGKLTAQEANQLERLNDEAIKDDTLGTGSGKAPKERVGSVSFGGGGGGGSGHAPRQQQEASPLEYAQALRQASSAAAKHGALGGGGSLDELQWMLQNGGLTQDEQKRLQMLEDIQQQKQDAKAFADLEKKNAEYFQTRDKYIYDWTFGGAQEARNAITGKDENYLANAIASGRDSTPWDPAPTDREAAAGWTARTPPGNISTSDFFNAAWDRVAAGAEAIGNVEGAALGAAGRGIEAALAAPSTGDINNAAGDAQSIATVNEAP